MLQTIKSRLQVIEQAKKTVNVPELVIIYWDALNGSWIAKEQYVKKNSKGKVIKGTGKEKKILLNSPKDYKAPEGFKGTLLIEGGLK